MEALPKTPQSYDLLHYTGVYRIFRRAAKDLKSEEKAARVVKEKLLETVSNVELLALQRENLEGAERIASIKKIAKLSFHLSVMLVITECVSIRLQDINEVLDVIHSLEKENKELALKTAKEMSLKNKQRPEVFTTLAKLFLSLEDFPKAQECIQEIPSEETRSELLAYINAKDESSSDLKLGVENIGFKSATDHIAAKLMDLSLEELEELKAQEKDLLDCHIRARAIYREKNVKGHRHLQTEPSSIYDMLIFRVVDQKFEKLKISSENIEEKK